MENTQLSLGSFHATAREQKQPRNNSVSSLDILGALTCVMCGCGQVYLHSEGGGAQPNPAA